ncbi:cilia- and flagella-associated protein 299-like isoform X1 [Dysidea avara]|uniref:cilia- and flagella-associated protein 299-like isoform X1 n=1 Tax=Dysidea avara TaxID=196820 RepID=UPI00332CE8FC
MAQEDSQAGQQVSDNIVSEFGTYQEFLDSQITRKDLFYLEDEELARQLVELGYRGSGEVLKRDEFEQRKQIAEASKLSRREQKTVLASAGKDLKGSVFLEALAEREEANRSGKMTVRVYHCVTMCITCCAHKQTILFIRDRNSKGQEISGYIDYAHRLKSEDFEPYFTGRRKLLPRHTDLSFYNWETNLASSTHSPNYQVISDNSAGLLFKNKRDRKIVNVDPKAPTPGDNTSRQAIPTTKYLQVVIFDHVTRRKA